LCGRGVDTAMGSIDIHMSRGLNWAKQFWGVIAKFFRSQKWQNKHFFVIGQTKQWNSFRPVIWSARNPFLARDSIYAIARYMPSPVRLSGRLSGRLSVCPSHGWISQRRFKIGSRNLHHSPMTLVSTRGTAPWNSNGKIGSGGAKCQRGVKKTSFQRQGHFRHCRYCIPIHQAALLSRA